MIQTKEKRASQRTEEYKIKKKIRDKRYREANQEKIKKRYREKHPNSKPRENLTPEESKKRRREKERKQKARRFKKNNEWINNYKRERCCASCGYKKHSEILHFHHVRKDKCFEISRKKDKSLDTLKKEIEKCVLLCPNCHSWLHFIVRKKSIFKV